MVWPGGAACEGKILRGIDSGGWWHSEGNEGGKTASVVEERIGGPDRGVGNGLVVRNPPLLWACRSSPAGELFLSDMV